jgi:hypothetical protein
MDSINRIDSLKITAQHRYAVVAAYAHAGFERGDIISRHSTYELARKAARRSGYDSFRGVRNLDL